MAQKSLRHSDNHPHDPQFYRFVDDPDDPFLYQLAARLYSKVGADQKMSEEEISWLETHLGDRYPSDNGAVLLPRHLTQSNLDDLSRDDDHTTTVPTAVYTIDERLISALDLQNWYLEAVNALDDWQTHWAAKEGAHTMVKKVAEGLAQRGKELQEKTKDDTFPDAEGRQLTEDKVWEALRGAHGGRATSYADSFLKADYEESQGHLAQAKEAVNEAFDAYYAFISDDSFQDMIVEQYEEKKNCLFLVAVLLSGCEHCEPGRQALDVQLGFDTINGTPGKASKAAFDGLKDFRKNAFDLAGFARQAGRMISLGLTRLRFDLAVAGSAVVDLLKIKDGKYKELLDLTLSAGTLGDLIEERTTELSDTFFGDPDKPKPLEMELRDFLASDAQAKQIAAEEAADKQVFAWVAFGVNLVSFTVAAHKYITGFKKKKTEDKIKDGIKLVGGLAGLAEMILRSIETMRKASAASALARGMQSEYASVSKSAKTFGRWANGIGAALAIISIIMDLVDVVQELCEENTEWENVAFKLASVVTGLVMLVAAFVGASLSAALNIVGVILTIVIYVLQLYFMDHPMVDWLEGTPWGAKAGKGDAQDLKKLLDVIDSYYKKIFGAIEIGFHEDLGRLELGSNAFKLEDFELTLEIEKRPLTIQPDPDKKDAYLINKKPTNSIELFTARDPATLFIYEPWRYWPTGRNEETTVRAGINLDYDRTPELKGEVERELPRKAAIVDPQFYQVGEHYWAPQKQPMPAPSAKGMALEIQTKLSDGDNLTVELWLGETMIGTKTVPVEPGHLRGTKYWTPIFVPYNDDAWAEFSIDPDELEGRYEVRLFTPGSKKHAAEMILPFLFKREPAESPGEQNS